MFIEDYSNKTDKPIVIIGAGEHGKMMLNFFKKNTSFEIKGFAVERKYITSKEVEGLPVAEFEKILDTYPPNLYRAFVAVTFVKLNEERKRLYNTAKAMGYEFVSYVDPSSIVDDTAKIGENVAIFENNVIQYNCTVGANTVMQAGGVVAHSTTVEDSVWIAPCVAIAGMSFIGRASFLGINSTIGNNLIIPPRTIVGAGTVVYKTIEKAGVYVGNPARLISESVERYF